MDKVIKKELILETSTKDIFDTLTIPEKHANLIDSNVEIDLKEGGKFSMWGGSVHGSYVEIVPDKKIVQKWRSDEENWEENEFSEVVFEISEVDGKTVLEFTQKNVPADVFENVRQGWEDYYWIPLKKMYMK